MISVENTSTPGNGHFPLGIFPLRHFRDTRLRRDTPRSASAALNAREPIDWPININRR